MTENSNSSHIHCARSASRQRTTPCAAGIGPASTITASRVRCSSLRTAARPGALRAASPLGPSALNRGTRSRRICSVTPAAFAASLRLPPSRISATANSRQTVRHLHLAAQAHVNSLMCSQIKPQSVPPSQAPTCLQCRTRFSAAWAPPR